MKTNPLLAVFVLLTITSPAFAQGKTENVILITLDGARTQEIFTGADLEILKSKTRRGNVEDTALYKKYWASTPTERREKLMPFFWGTLMKQYGSIAGNRSLGSTVMTTNKMWFSYPGYSEILTGQAHDDVIKSNDAKRNPYPSVLEFLKTKLNLDSKRVAAFGSWDVFNFIAESKEGAITINAGHERYPSDDPEIAVLARLQDEKLSPWDTVRFDYFTMRFALAHLKAYQPRVLYIALGETDDWAHSGEYGHVLHSLEQNDRQIKLLWDYLQSTEQYRDKTSIIITIDHGRGANVNDWTDHGEKVPEAQYIWMAFLSPDVSLRGEWRNAETIYQNQAAATLSKLLRLDFNAEYPQAGKPINRLFTAR